MGRGASPTFQDRDGKSALHLAAACGHLSCLATLLGNTSEDMSELQDSQGCTVLHWACYNGEEMVSKARRNNTRITVYSPVEQCLISACYPMISVHHVLFSLSFISVFSNSHTLPLDKAPLNGHFFFLCWSWLSCASCWFTHSFSYSLSPWETALSRPNISYSVLPIPIASLRAQVFPAFVPCHFLHSRLLL